MSAWAWPALGNWHVIKMAQTCIWRLAGPAFLAPLFHTLFPKCWYPHTPRHSFASRMLTLVRLSYPHWKAELQTALLILLPGSTRNHAQNLHFLCEFFIPTVSRTCVPPLSVFCQWFR